MSSDVRVQVSPVVPNRSWNANVDQLAGVDCFKNSTVSVRIGSFALMSNSTAESPHANKGTEGHWFESSLHDF